MGRLLPSLDILLDLTQLQASENAKQCGGDPTKAIAIGVSSGGGLVLAATRKILLGESSLSKDTIKEVVALVLTTIHPDTGSQIYGAYSSYTECKEGVPMIDAGFMKTFYNAVGVECADEDFFATLDRDSHKLFPPVYICACQFDPVRDDGKVMIKSLAEVGVKTKYDCYVGLPHIFWIFPGIQER
jgi:versiconal hemiacetal acetate esterase